MSQRVKEPRVSPRSNLPSTRVKDSRRTVLVSKTWASHRPRGQSARAVSTQASVLLANRTVVPRGERC